MQCEWCNWQLSEKQIDEAEVTRASGNVLIFNLDGRIHRITVYRNKGEASNGEKSESSFSASDCREEDSERETHSENYQECIEEGIFEVGEQPQQGGWDESDEGELND